MVKVLQLISSSHFYGAEKMVVELSSALQQEGDDAVIASLSADGVSAGLIRQRAAARHVRTREVRCRGRFDHRAVAALRRFIVEGRADVIHCHGYKADIYARMASARLNLPLVATCHNWLGESIAMKSYRWFDRMVLRSFDQVVAVSETLRCQLERNGIEASRLKLIPNGIRPAGVPAFSEDERQRLRQELGIAPGETALGAVGRLSPEKGQIHLIAAFTKVRAAYPRVRLLFAGDGELADRLRIAALEKGVGSQVTFLGSRDDIERVLAALEIFVLPSLTEGMPMALLEAMAAGLPVVATPVGEVPNIITDGVNGLLVPPADEDRLAGALIRLLGDPGYGRRLGEDARTMVLRNYSARSMALRYRAVYQEALKKKV
jgi:glycosyltransferase involved in cell wall biosynthesis